MSVISTVDYVYSIIHFYILCVLLIVPTIPRQLNGASATNNDKHIVLPEAQFIVDNFIITAEQDKDIGRLVFQPNILEFEKLAVGESVHKVVTIINNHTNRSVYLGSISGSVPEFQSSFFDANFIPPLGNTTFSVVFLPRYQIPIQGHLTIQTSFGVLSYTVTGNGTECPYRLSPLIGLNAPLNATLTPEVYMYNPYSTPIQIVEIYSSGGQFQLELPTDADDSKKGAEETISGERSQSVWTIPSYLTRPIIRIRFTATTPGKHTAYIRIKISSKSVKSLRSKVLIIPIEVECFKEYGIYSSVPFLDFGIAGRNDRPKDFSLKLKSSGKTNHEILSYHVEAESEIQDAIIVNMLTKEIEAEDSLANSIFNVMVAWSKINVHRLFRGHILVKAKAKSSKEVADESSVYKIPFIGEIIAGSIHYNETIANFRMDDDSSRTRQFRLRNDYEVPLAIMNITFDAYFHNYFRIEGFQPKVLSPGMETTLFNVTLVPSASEKLAAQKLYLHSNISTYDIDFITFSGHLRRILPINELSNVTYNNIDSQPDEKLIDFGTLPLSTKSHVMLAFVNQNPLAISINNWKGTISSAATIEIVMRGCSRMKMVDLKFCDRVEEGEWILFQLSVSSNAVGTFVGQFTVKTEFEEINTPIKFSTDMGILKFKTAMVGGESCFHGGLCRVNLTAYSTFMHTIEVDSILAVNLSGTRFNYTKTGEPIKSSAETNIAQIDFIPPKLCDYDCHIEYPDRWMPSAIIDSFQSGKSGLLSQKLRQFRRFKTVLSSILFYVQTNFIKRYDFNGSVALSWPRLAGSQLDFPVIQTGHETVQYLEVFNPTNETMVVYYTLHEYTTNLATHLPPEVISDCWNCALTRDQVFSFVDEDVRNSRIQYIAPKSAANVGIRFSPQLPGNFSTLLYIRNNLTVMEAVWLVAKAALPQFKFGNRKPGSRTPLLFELSEKTLFDCNQANGHVGGYSIKRTFTAKNSGETPIQIKSFRIDNFSCEGYGYRIIDCSPFELAPNSSKKIGISFSPDFTLAMVKKMLYIETSLGYSINYTLLSMISPLCLETCSKSLPRPYWEYILKNGSACIAVITFICVLLAAYLDAMKNLQNHLKNLTRAKGVLQPALDLRQIGSRLCSNEVKEKDQAAAQITVVKTTSPTAVSSKIALNTKKQKVPPKKRVENVIVENGGCKQRSWTSEPIEKATEKIVEDKDDDTKPKTLSPSEKYNKKPKERSRLKITPAKSENDEDVLSTSTENSNQSDEKLTTKDLSKKVIFNESFEPKDRNIVKKPKKSPPQSRVSSELNVQSDMSAVKFTNSVPPEEPLPQPIPRKITPRPSLVDPMPIAKKQPKKKPVLSEGSKYFDGNHLNSISKREKLTKDYATKPVQGNGYHYSFPMSQQPVVTSQSPTNPNRVSFSRVVQNPSPNPPPTMPPFSSMTTKRDMNPIEKLNPGMNNFNIDHVPFVNDSYERLEKPRASVDLGPIGTRKTPSAAPTWRPFNSMRNNSLTLDSILNGNSDHFHSNPSNANNLNYNRSQFVKNNQPNAEYFLNTRPPPVNLSQMDRNQVLEEQNKRIWDSAILLDILQQQQNIQQESENRRINQSFPPAQSVHPSAHPSAHPSNNTEFQRFYRHGNNMWNAEQSYSEQNFVDQSFVGNPNNNRHSQPAEHWSPPQPSQQIRPPPGLGHIVIRNNQNSPEQSQYGGEQAEMPQYNPFNTLSSIWSSDSWPTNLCNRNSEQQQ